MEAPLVYIHARSGTTCGQVHRHARVGMCVYMHVCVYVRV